MTAAPSVCACMLTPAGRGGIAVVRMTGGCARRGVEEIFSNAFGVQPGQLRFGKIIRDGDVLDEAVLACISDDEFEINIHGGSAVGRLTLDALAATGCEVEETSAAVPEFSPKHPDFDNPGIGAEMQQILPEIAGEFALGVITSQWSGGLSALLSGDFSADDLRAAAGRLEAVEKLLNWPEVVIAGRPNAGKSTLANAIVGRDVSIVHSMAGTTRDWVRERAMIMERPVWLTDTAGLWQAEGLHDVDTQAVERAWKQIRQADLVILASCNEDEIELPAEISAKKIIRISTKADEIQSVSQDAISVSAVTGQGLDELKSAIIHKLGLDKISPNLPAAFTKRQQVLLFNVANAMECGDTITCTKLTWEILINKI